MFVDADLAPPSKLSADVCIVGRDLVVVEGWHLSRSEARLYALLALE